MFEGAAPSFDKLPSLTFLSLQNNRFIGQIPSLSSSSNLNYMFALSSQDSDFSNNHFVSVPVDFFENRKFLHVM